VGARGAAFYLSPFRGTASYSCQRWNAWNGQTFDIWGNQQFQLATGQTTSTLGHLIIMTLAESMSDRAKASRADVEYPSMARRNRAEVVVADEIGAYHCCSA